MGGKLTNVDDVDVALGELAKATFLRALAAPYRLDLVAAEGKGQLACVLQHVSREGHRQVEVETQLGVAGRGLRARSQTADRVDLLVRVLPLAGEALDRLHRPGLDRGEPVQLEGLADHVLEVLLDDALTGQPLGEATDRTDFAHGANPCRYGFVARSRSIVVAGP